jgi:hypothetical protein
VAMEVMEQVAPVQEPEVLQGIMGLMRQLAEEGEDRREEGPPCRSRRCCGGR